VRLYRILQLTVFLFCPFTRTVIRPVDTGIHAVCPSFPTLFSRLTRDVHGNCDPILATVRLYRTLQLDGFIFWSFTLTSTRSAEAGIQVFLPSIPTLKSRSTRNQCGNYGPILATVPLYRILQFVVFVWCPFTRTFIRPVDAGIQGIMPSLKTLISRSTRHQRGNYDPVLVTVRLYRILQLAIFVFCPFTRVLTCPVDAGIQGSLPSVFTL
jgi:hypothetical protein